MRATAVVRRQGRRLALAMLCLCCLPALAAAETPASQEPAEGFFLSPKLRRLIGSHTSYQFGDPDQR